MPTVIQTNSSSFLGGTGHTVTLTGVAVGDVLVCTFAVISQQAILSITTTAGSTSAWTTAASAFVATNDNYNGVFLATALSSGTITVQITTALSPRGQMGLMEVSGVSSTTTDGSNTANNSGPTSISTGSVTPTIATDLAIALCSSTSANVTAGPGGSWTNVGLTGAPGNGGLAAYQVLTGTAPISATFPTGGFINLALIVLITSSGGSQIVMVV